MTTFAETISGAYLVIGLCIALRMLFARRDTTTALVAIIAWPLVVTQEVPAEHGPLSQAIERRFSALRVVMGRTEHADWSGEILVLQEALYNVDHRVALVDSILADVDAGGDHITQLQDARTRAVAEVDAVLGELDRLRAQMGMVALSGDTLPVREGLSALTARIHALDELSRLGGQA